MGAALYPQATELLITADGGGSNSARTRLWKRELQHFADESGLRVGVSPWRAGRWSSASLAPQQLLRDCVSRLPWMLVSIRRASKSVMLRCSPFRLNDPSSMVTGTTQFCLIDASD